MRKLLYLLGGVAVGVAVARLLRGRRSEAVEQPAPSSSPGAETLRAQLAASRVEVAPTVEEPPAVDEEPGVVDVEAARRRVHDRGRETVDEMRRSAGSG
jgi:hypothetical protein